MINFQKYWNRHFPQCTSAVSFVFITPLVNVHFFQTPHFLKHAFLRKCAISEPKQGYFPFILSDCRNLLLVPPKKHSPQYFLSPPFLLPPLPSQVEVSPLENAIEVIENKNLQLRTLITQCQSRQMQNINPLTMCLNGVIDAAVNGGLARYQEVRMDGRRIGLGGF